MKKVLVVITTSFVEYGGLTSVMMNYFEKINSDKIMIDFASTNKPKNEDKAYKKILKKGSTYFYLGDRKKHLYNYMRSLYKIIKNEEYEIVHINGNSATMIFELLVCKLLGVKKIIAHVHTTRSNHPIFNRIMRPLLKLLYTDAIAVSDKAGKWLFKKDYFVLNNAIDVENYKYNEKNREYWRHKLGFKENEVVIGHIGKLYEPKNHVFMLKLFNAYLRKNENARLVFVGGGSLEQQLKKMSFDLKINNKVTFLGMRNDVNTIMQSFDIFLFPSLYEGLGLALIEAQAAGLTCFASTAVPRETQVSNTIKYLDLSESIDLWADELMNAKIDDRFFTSRNNISNIRNHGYDVSYEVCKLESIYEGECNI